MNQPISPFPVDPKQGRRYGLWIAAGVAAVLLVFGGGLAFGFWFATHYRIVPVNAPQHVAQQTQTAPEAVPAPSAQPQTESQAQSQGAPAFKSAPPPAAQPASSPPADGPFRFRFTPHEKTRYQLHASIKGQGLDLGDSSGVNMQMASVMKLDTQKVAPDGTASVQLHFDDTSLTGDFMNEPFSLFTGGNQAHIQSNGKTVTDTNKTPGAVQKNPQLHFLNAPINMTVSPNGQVTHLDGPEGIASALGQVPMYSDLDFPSGDLHTGQEWDSDFELPIPGFPVPARAKMHNVFKGYTNYQGKNCAIIEQQIVSQEKNGALQSGGLNSDSSGFQMPLFKLSGGNLVYFDVDAGKLAYSKSDLKVKLELSKALGPAGEALESLLNNMDSVLGQDLPEFQDKAKKDGQKKKHLLDLDLDIRSTLSRMPDQDKPQKSRP